MLRRRLLVAFGSLVALLLIVTVGATWMLYGIVQDMDRLTGAAMSFADGVSRLDASVHEVQVTLYQLQLSQEHHLDRLIDQTGSLEQAADHLASYPMAADWRVAPLCRDIREDLPAFERHIAAMATTLDPELIRQHSQGAADVSARVHERTLRLKGLAQQNVTTEGEGLVRRFRSVVLGLAVVFLVVVNVTVVLLARISVAIVNPIERLVHAGEQLALERFDYRVDVGQTNEFGKLARAFNLLAKHLQESEHRRLETVQQVAVSLNHELNNALAIIDLQLRYIDSSTAGDTAAERCLGRIRQNLQRMAQVVESLKHIRKIVLTDYLAGLKMLDLKRSAEPRENEPPPEGAEADWRGWL